MPLYRNYDFPTYTWATLPAASTMYGKFVVVTDIGSVDDFVFRSNGTIWEYTGLDMTLSSSSLGWVVPSLLAANAATYSQTGTTITVSSTAHSLTSAQNDRSVYLVIGTGLATTGWFTNFTYIDANSFSCTSTVSQSTSGFVNTNTANITIPESSITVPGGLMGINGSLLVNAMAITPSDANIKRLRFDFDAVNLVNRTVTTSTALGMNRILRNRGSQSKQITGALSVNAEYAPGASAVPVEYTVNTAVDKTAFVSIGCASASEFISLENFEILVRRGA